MDALAERERMVEQQLIRRGIADERVLRAMAEVPRERFVPDRLRSLAYADRPLPLALGQTISQPFIVARTLALLELGPDDIVLDVGTGSGYAAAVVSRIVAEVWSIECLPELAESAEERLADLGYDNVMVRVGNGRDGWAGRAPFDAIQVAAASHGVPLPLTRQLAIGGRLVLPLGDDSSQRLTVVRRSGAERWQQSHFDRVRFVPLVGG